MNWTSIKLGVPVGFLGGLIAVSAFTGIKGDEFNVTDPTQWVRMGSLFFAGFINSLVSFLLGLKTPEPWDRKERRNGDILNLK